VINLDIDRGLFCTINNAGYFTVTAKTAARTRSLHRTGIGNNFHELLLQIWRPIGRRSKTLFASVAAATSNPQKRKGTKTIQQIKN
jgi:hypothetical protein